LTLPPSLEDLEPETESEHELSRLTLVVGGLRLDLGLPGNVAIAAFIDDVIDIANEQIAIRQPDSDVEYDDEAGRWTLARLGSDPIDPHRSLSEAGIYDGELLMIREAGKPLSPLLFDDIEDDDADSSQQPVLTWLADNAPMLTCYAVALAASTTVALQMPRWSGVAWVPAAVLALGAIGVIVACAVALRAGQSQRSAWLTASSLPLLFAGSLYVVPDGFGSTSLPMAFALTALAALLILLITGHNRALYTAVIAVCVFGGVAAAADLLLDPPPRAVGAVMATVAVIVVYLAPRATILLSKLPIPRVPTAGEPLDDIETQGGTTVEGVSAVGKQVIPTEEGLIARVRRANGYLTGILIAAALAAATGSYLAVDVSDGFFWQGTVFAIVVSVVLCLRGRSHHDLIQSGALISGGMIIGFALVVKTALNLDGWQVYAVAALVVLMAILVACGLVAPRLEFSPVMRRQVEIVEYISIALVFPLCFWIIRLYAFFRELRI
jgi:type VII secretion integral membrane protein EccD